MFCSPPGRASAQLGPGRVKILRLAFQVTTASQQKKHPLFVFTSAPPATGQLLSRLITQPRDWLGPWRLIFFDLWKQIFPNHSAKGDVRNRNPNHNAEDLERAIHLCEWHSTSPEESSKKAAKHHRYES